MRLTILVSVVALLVPTTSCGSDSEDVSSEGVSPENMSGEVVVFAAASLAGAFTKIGDAFSSAHPDVDVVLNVGASSALVSQIAEGAPADVFASADERSIARLPRVRVGDPVVFATNTMEIVVAPGNPLGIRGLTDVADPELIVVICSPEVPCGGYAAEVIARAEVELTPKSFEQNVSAVVAKVTLGEADAGIVYRTDVAAAGDDAAGVEIPADVNVVARYPIAVTADAPNRVGAEAFVEFVTSAQAAEILAAYGFGSP